MLEASSVFIFSVDCTSSLSSSFHIIVSSSHQHVIRILKIYNLQKKSMWKLWIYKYITYIFLLFFYFYCYDYSKSGKSEEIFATTAIAVVVRGSCCWWWWRVLFLLLLYIEILIGFSSPPLPLLPSHNLNKIHKIFYLLYAFIRIKSLLEFCWYCARGFWFGTNSRYLFRILCFSEQHEYKVVFLSFTLLEQLIIIITLCCIILLQF